MKKHSCAGSADGAHVQREWTAHALLKRGDFNIELVTSTVEPPTFRDVLAALVSPAPVTVHIIKGIRILDWGD